ncbi:MAG: helix-turn-helix domain-containing protein [Candidatus Thermoplasmatota archaeon]
MYEDVPPCKPPKDAHPRWLKLRDLVKALRFPTRWAIIEYIGDGVKSTTEIYEHLIGRGEQLTKPGFYYHLSELKNAGIIEVAEYREERGGAPEKIWKLKTKRIVFDLLQPDEEAG